MKNGRVGIGIVGLGHWGPNHVRVFHQSSHAEVKACCDPDARRRAYISKAYPGARVFEKAEELFSRKDVEAVVIATPAGTHFALAKAALSAGKHVLLEKPMCASLKEAEELFAAAGAAGKVVMHGHVFIHNPGIRYIKEALSRGDLGHLQYLHATRTNLGPIRPDVNVIQDLAIHEFSIFHCLFDAVPVWIQAAGGRPLKTPREDVAFISMEFPGGVLAHAHVSWLHPQKIRTLTAVGDKKMVFWNDMDAAEPVRVFDKGVMEEPYYDSFGQFRLLLRDSGVLIPKLSSEEPLKLQAEAFLGRVRDGVFSSKEAAAGLEVMRCLEAAQRSLQNEGGRVYLK